MTAVTTLFTPEEKSTSNLPPGSAAALYALTSAIWLVLAIEDFRRGRHTGLACMHAILAAVSLSAMVMHWSCWRKERSVS